jgi:hypothetical protein
MMISSEKTPCIEQFQVNLNLFSTLNDQFVGE